MIISPQAVVKEESLGVWHVKDGGASLSQISSMGHVPVLQIIIPLTRASPTARCRLYDLVPAQHVGRPTYYVIHT